jgi:hypothetical protein
MLLQPLPVASVEIAKPQAIRVAQPVVRTGFERRRASVM